MTESQLRQTHWLLTPESWEGRGTGENMEGRVHNYCLIPIKDMGLTYMQDGLSLINMCNNIGRAIFKGGGGGGAFSHPCVIFAPLQRGL